MFSAIVDWISSIHTDVEQRAGAAEVRMATHAAIAGGAKSIYFRTQGKGQEEAAHWLIDDWRPVSTLLGLAEPVEITVQCSEPTVTARVLLCGDKGMFLMLFNTSFPEHAIENPFSVIVPLPQGFTAGQCFEIDGDRAHPKLAVENGVATVGLDGLRSSRAFLLVPEG